MSAPAEPVPTLELPSDRLMQWSQMALLLAHSLGQRREQLERHTCQTTSMRPVSMTSPSEGRRSSPQCAL